MKLLVIMALSFCLAAPAGAKSAEAPKEGDKAPAFALQSQTGETVALEDLKGKWVVLYFYPKDFTSGCTLEARGFQKNAEEFAKRGAVILGVSGQSAETHKEFCDKESLSFRLLADSKLRVAKSYGSTMMGGLLAARTTFLISPGGFVARRWLKVSPGAHADELLAALDELKAEK